MKKKVILAVSAVIVAAAAVFGVRTAMSEIESDMIFNANVEALARTEQPNTVMCIFDPYYDCEALHPTDPEKDDIRYFAKWW